MMDAPNPMPRFEHAFGFLPAYQSISNLAFLPLSMRRVQVTGGPQSWCANRMRTKIVARRDHMSR